MKYVAIVCTLLAFGLAGCGGPKEGTVIGKKYEPSREWTEWDSCAHTEYVTKTRLNSDGGTEMYQDSECRGGWENRYDDEDWKLHLEKCKESGTKGVTHGDKKYERKCKTGWVTVKKEAFDKASVGSYYAGDGNVRDWDSD